MTAPRVPLTVPKAPPTLPGNPFADEDRAEPKAAAVRSKANLPGNPFADEGEVATPADPVVGPLTVATERARHGNAGLYAEAYALAQRTRLPVETVVRRIDQVRALAGDRDFEPGEFARAHPATAAWLADETHATVAKDDWKNLGLIERLFGADWRVMATGEQRSRLETARSVAATGGLMPGAGGVPVTAAPAQRGLLAAEYDRERVVTELGRLGVIPPGQQDAAVRAQIASLRARRAEELPAPESFVERMARGSARFAPSIEESLKAGGVGAAVGGAVGGALGNVPGAVFGAKVGGGLNAFLAAATMEGGNAAIEFADIGREEGQPVDPSLAYGYGMAYGAASGAVELVGLNFLLAPLAQAGKTVARRGVSRALQAPTTRAALLAGAKAWAGAVAGETATEVVQQGLQLAAESDIRTLSNWLDDTTLPGVGMERVGHELLSTAVETAIGTVLIGLPGGAATTVADMGRVQAAQATRDRLEMLSASAKGSALRERAPEVFRELAARQVEATGGARNVYVEAERVQALLQENEVSEDEFVQAAGLTPEAWRAATALTGADVVIPMPDFVARIAGTPLGDALLPDVRLEQGALSARAAEAAAKDIEKDVAAVREEMQDLTLADVTEERERFVIEDLTAKLEATGAYTPDQVRVMVEAAAKPYIVLGRRYAATNPERDARWLYETRNLRLVGGERADLLLDTTRAIEKAVADGKSPEEVGQLRVRFQRLTNDRVAIRAAMESAEQTEGVRDEAGRLKRSLRFVSDEALVLEYITLRDQVAQAEGELLGIETTPDYQAALNMNPEMVEDRTGAVEGIEFMRNVEGGWAGLQALMGESRRLVQRYSRTVPRLAAELSARGITDPDTYAAERDLTGDATFEVDQLEQAATREPSEAERDVREMLARQAALLRRTAGTLAARGRLSDAELARVSEVIGTLPVALEQAYMVPGRGIVLEAGEGFVQWTVAPKKPWRVATADGQLPGAWDTAEQAERAMKKAGLVPAVPRPAPQDGEQLSLLQRGRAAPNAFILPGRTEQIIGLMGGANLSSFLHEMGHEYLNLLAFVAEQPDAPASVAADLDVALTELGVAEADRATFLSQLRNRDALDPKARAKFTAIEEKWARAFEAYLKSGNAPSRALLGAFTRFRIWLTEVYRAVTSVLPSAVSPALRGVFDRLLATEEELATMQGQPEATPLFETAEQGGMTEAEFAAYRATVQHQADLSGAQLAQALLAETEKARTTAWIEREAEVRATVEAAVDADPTERAVVYFKTGTLPDGTATAPAKLAKSLLIPVYGPNITKTLPRGTFAVEGGVDADSAALVLGFPTGDALVAALQAYEPRAKKVERIVAQEMRRLFPDLLYDSPALAEATLDAMHRPESDDVLVTELRKLGRTVGIEAPNLPAVKQVAREIIGQTAARDLSPQRFHQAERKAARLAEQALRGGNPAKAEFHKRQQLLNRILYREARGAVERVATIQRFFADRMKATSQERLGKAGAMHRDAMNTLLDRYEWRSVSLRRMDRRASLADYVAKVAGEEYVALAMPAHVLADAAQQNYRTLTMDELEGVYDAGRMIWHVATQKDKLLRKQEKADLNATAAAVADGIAAHHEMKPRQMDTRESPFTKADELRRAIDAWHLPPEFLFRWLDGDALGVTWDAFFKPMVDAEAAENTRLREVDAQLKALEAMVPEARKREFWDREVVVPGLAGRVKGRTIIALARNWGSESNREALMESMVDGQRVWASPQAIEAALSMLTPDELAYVQATWDYINTFWPDIKALEERMVGVAPEKVEAAPFAVRAVDGTVVQMRGGYYPLKYDPKLSVRQSFQDAAQLAEGVNEIAPSGAARAATRHGFTETRVGSGGKPVLLDLSVLNRHVIDVVHDLTHREAVRDVARLYRHPEVQAAIVQSAGQPLYESLRPWLVRIAAGDQMGDASPAERLLSLARTGTTVVNMGFKVTTGVTQILGYTQSLDMIGPRWMAKGLRGFLANPRRAWRTVREASSEMANRQTNYNRDVRDYAVSRQGKWARRDEFFFAFVGMMDMVVSVPTWMGAYRQSMESMKPGDHEAAVDYADSVVRTTQSAGSPKDLARVQGGPELRRLLTMHYSFFSRLYGLFRRSGTNLTEGRWGLPRFAASMTLIWVASAVLSELLAGRWPDGEDDEPVAEWLFVELARYPASTVVGLRDLAQAVGPDRFDYKLTPAEDAMIQTGRTLDVAYRATLGDLLDGETEFELSEADIKAMTMTAGYWGRLPARQAWITGTAMYDWMMGYDQPEGVADAVRDLSFTRPR